MRRWVKTTPIWIDPRAIKAAREFVPAEVASLVMRPGETMAERPKWVSIKRVAPGTFEVFGL